MTNNLLNAAGPLVVVVAVYLVAASIFPRAVPLSEGIAMVDSGPLSGQSLLHFPR
jgi:hypothetical protein